MTRWGYPSASFCIIRLMPDNTSPEFIASIAPEAVEVHEDHLVFPGGILLPLFARGTGVPGSCLSPRIMIRQDNPSVEISSASPPLLCATSIDQTVRFAPFFA
jgi:hypothetical protein